MTLAIGTKVRMSEALKAKLLKECVGGVHVGPFDPGEPGSPDDPGGDCWGCSSGHVEEFGKSEGLVIGLTDYNNCKPGELGYDPTKVGPEVDVRWEPSLRYAYHPDDLEVIVNSEGPGSGRGWCPSCSHTKGAHTGGQPSDITLAERLRIAAECVDWREVDAVRRELADRASDAAPLARAIEVSLDRSLDEYVAEIQRDGGR